MVVLDLKEIFEKFDVFESSYTIPPENLKLPAELGELREPVKVDVVIRKEGSVADRIGLGFLREDRRSEGVDGVFVKREGRVSKYRLRGHGHPERAGYKYPRTEPAGSVERS